MQTGHFRPDTFGERGRIVQTVAAVSGVIFTRDLF